jgi:hypothetical protein
MMCMFCRGEDEYEYNKLLPIKREFPDGSWTIYAAHIDCMRDASYIKSDYEDLQKMIKKLIK